ncbi:hypothetical protein HNQ60_003484 [Povalibacter uvarum]|uniref:Fe2OG dioxygenase domain-containing protein n=1 Tax=Povalibacter uvarum TaxID=732238 RepID=A0A841HN87_9GAMM|nr:2OG-Fe(II) oxygenase [Povalibacter uvarum]MBB6094597.1 hypothetical protein [Povalibacter uvarum]
MSDPEIKGLLERVRAGDVGSLVVLAKRVLVGEGIKQAPPDAIAMLEMAVKQGAPEAALQLSVCAAWGVGLPRNPQKAIEYLVMAAGFGSTVAKRELALLGCASDGAHAQAKQPVDLSALTTAHGVRIVSERPRILVVERFATEAECAWLIERGRPALTRALVYRGSADAQVAQTRTNTEMGFTIFHADVLLSLLRDRMAAVLQTSTRFFEVTKLLHYEPGEQFALHGDFLQTNTPELAQEVDLRGQRSTTFLVYLNDGFEGGETDFPRLGFRYKGNRGDALVFSNLQADGSPDYSTVHAGLATTRGEKWLLSQWVRTKPVG